KRSTHSSHGVLFVAPGVYVLPGVKQSTWTWLFETKLLTLRNRSAGSLEASGGSVVGNVVSRLVAPSSAGFTRLMKRSFCFSVVLIFCRGFVRMYCSATFNSRYSSKAAMPFPARGSGTLSESLVRFGQELPL